jgi:hypothetical protein
MPFFDERFFDPNFFDTYMGGTPAVGLVPPALRMPPPPEVPVQERFPLDYETANLLVNYLTLKLRRNRKDE